MLDYLRWWGEMVGRWWLIVRGGESVSFRFFLQINGSSIDGV